MKTVPEILHHLMESAGIDVTSEDAKKVITKLAGITDELPETITAPLTTNLLNLDAARNNPTIKGHYFKQFRDGDEAYFGQELSALGITVDFKGKDFKKEISGVIKTLKAERKDSDDPTKTKELTDKINALQRQLETASDTATQTVKGEYENKLKEKEAELDSVFQSLELAKYELAGSADTDIKISMALSQIQKEVSAIGGMIVRNGKSFKIVTASDATQELFVNNKVVKYDEFVKKVLVDKKLIVLKSEEDPAKKKNASDAPTGAKGMGFLSSVK